MKLVTYVGSRGGMRLGVVVRGPSVVAGKVGNDQVLDLFFAAERAGMPVRWFRTMMDLIEAGEKGLDTTRKIIERHGHDEDITQPLILTALRAPLPEPAQMRDFSVFPDHITGAPAGAQRLIAKMRGDEAAAAAAKPAPEVPTIYRERPIYYITNRFSVTGDGADVIWPSYSKVMDYELEFGIILSKGGRDIPLAKAKDHIFGYTIYNDFSARDAQMIEMQGMLGPAKGKSFDGGNVLGPYLVTKDEVPNPYELEATAKVNGQVWTQSSTRGMLHSFEDMIAYVSRSETLHVGEFFGSGTVNGGCGLEHSKFLSNGDEVALTIEGLGTLTNRVRASA